MSTDGPSNLTPRDAFVALGNETRVDILHALVEHERSTTGQDGLAFSALRREVGVRDASKFNYHLKQLRGQFVEKTGDGYRLRYAGEQVVSALAAGTFTDLGRARATEVDVDCPSCRAPLTARYEDQTFQVECPAHGPVGQLPLPPGAAAHRSIPELYDVASKCGYWYLDAVRERTCPSCWGPVETTFLDPGTADVAGSWAYVAVDDQLLVRFACRHCRMTLHAPVGACAVRHPVVAAFLHDHGVDLPGASVFEVDGLWTADAVATVSDGSTHVRLTLRMDGEAIEVTLDDDATVVSHAV